MKFTFSLYLALVTTLVSFVHQEAQAEPWLANKFSNNCAACHSPGRVNRAKKKRKCTLSCQGCHVNPNGGGIRTAYGKWNSQRWLKSANIKSWIHGKKTPAPRNMQPYAHKYPETIKPKNINKKAQKFFKPKGKSRLVTLSKYTNRPELYDKHYDSSAGYEAKTEKEFETYLTKNDPYFIEKKGEVMTNVEARYLVLSNSGDKGPGTPTVGYRESSGLGLMALDLGLRFKPFVNKSWNLVFEHRYLNSPYVTEWNAIFRGGFTRSAYIMNDKLPYNSYVLAGIYRPMFGNQNPNHRALREVIAFGYTVPGRNASSRGGAAGSAVVRNEGITFGTAPNVPFFNFHYLTNSGVSGVANPATGFVVNAGYRFVTLGASIVGSYWSTESDESGPELSKDMFAVTLGGHYKGLVGNFEFLGFDEEFSPGASNSGNVMTLELKYQIFKETYLTTSFATSNTSRTQEKGSATDMSFGYRAFVLSGLEFDLAYWLHSDTNDAAGSETDWSSVQIQTHLYF